MKLTVEVTQEDIKNGKVGDNMSCPVGLAVTRAAVDAGLDITYGIGLNDAEVAKKCDTFAKKFDAGEAVEPFSFEFDAVKQTELSDIFNKLAGTKPAMRGDG